MARLLGLCGALGKDRSAQPAMRRREAIIRPMWIMVAGPWGLGTRSEEEKAANLRRMNEAALEAGWSRATPQAGKGLPAWNRRRSSDFRGHGFGERKATTSGAEGG